jgi:hypothetical protein
MTFPNIWRNKNVPNHQPAIHSTYESSKLRSTMVYPPVNIQKAMENGPFMNDLPILKW